MATSLFGISCTRQIHADTLLRRPADVTRSTVQKAVVVVADSPRQFGHLREKLSIVTKAWFAQRDFSDVEILQRFQESVAKAAKEEHDEEKDQYVGMALRELVHDFRHHTLVLFKCALLQPKMLFFGSQCERLCMLQFALISLIPGLLRNLQDCADPALDSYERSLVMPTSLRTSERASLLSYMGLPLQIFGKGSLFGPYTPLQQLDILADAGTRSYIVGSTNPLLLQQKDRYSDVLINVDDTTVSITSPSLRSALALSTPDRRWIDFLTQSVAATWNPSDPAHPTTHGYAGSEEFIRLQFEEYLLALLSSVKYRLYVQKYGASNASNSTTHDPKALLSDIDGDPALDFSDAWIEAWMKTDNYRLFSKFTDTHLFDIVEPRHPCAGGLTIEDVQRRVAAQIRDLGLDERISHSREALGKHLALGRGKVSTAFNNLWTDIETMREAQRKKTEEVRLAATAASPSSSSAIPANEPAAAAASPATTVSSSTPTSPSSSSSPRTTWRGPIVRPPDLSHAHATVQAASTRAGAYLSSWGSWAQERRKASWGGREGGNSGGANTSATAAATTPLSENINRPAVTTVTELAKNNQPARMNVDDGDEKKSGGKGSGG